MAHLLPAASAGPLGLALLKAYFSGYQLILFLREGILLGMQDTCCAFG